MNSGLFLKVSQREERVYRIKVFLVHPLCWTPIWYAGFGWLCGRRDWLARDSFTVQYVLYAYIYVIQKQNL